MKKAYIKPQTVATAIESECEILAGSTGSTLNVTVDTSKTLESDDAVGAKGNTGLDFWGDDNE